jgi:hypothetical protein
MYVVTMHHKKKYEQFAVLVDGFTTRIHGTEEAKKAAEELVKNPDFEATYAREIENVVYATGEPIE